MESAWAAEGKNHGKLRGTIAVCNHSAVVMGACNLYNVMRIKPSDWFLPHARQLIKYQVDMDFDDINDTTSTLLLL